MLRKALNADLSRFTQDDLLATLQWLAYAKRHLIWKFWKPSLIYMVLVARFAINRELNNRFNFPGYSNPYSFPGISLAEMNKRWDYADDLERDALISGYWNIK